MRSWRHLLLVVSLLLGQLVAGAHAVEHAASKEDGLPTHACQLCLTACPSKVIALVERKVNAHGYPFVYAVHPDDCVGCAICGQVCPDGCITVYRKKMEA